MRTRTELNQSLSQLIAMLEATIPANPAKHESLEKRLAKSLARYFRSIDNALPWAQIEALYNNLVILESIRESWTVPGLDNILTPIMAMFADELSATIERYAVGVYLTGSAEMTSWGRTQAGIPIAFEGPPMQEAVNYANTRAAQLVTNMNQETKDRLAKVVGDAIQNKSGTGGLAKAIRDEFDGMSRYRSQLIARTETRDALFHASQDRMVAMGVTGKEWILGSGGREGNCADCRANADAGVIPVDQEFPTPQYEIHPNCTCGIAPVMI